MSSSLTYTPWVDLKSVEWLPHPQDISCVHVILTINSTTRTKQLETKQCSQRLISGLIIKPYLTS